MVKRWHQTIFLFVALSSINARPQQDKSTHYKSLEASNDSSGLLSDAPSIKKPEKNLEDIAVVARSSYVPPPPVLSEKVSGTTIEKDIRTPPKLKEIVEKDSKNETVSTTTTTTTLAPAPAVEKVEANGKFKIPSASPAIKSSFEGKAASSKKEDVVKGVAVPVIMDEEVEAPPKKLQKLPNVVKPKEEKKKVVTVKPLKEGPTTTPSSGLSTWILLSDNREATTPTSAKKKVTTTTKKPVKLQSTATTVKVVSSKPNKKVTATIDKKPETPTALETLVRQKTASGIVTASKKEKLSETKKVVTIPPAISIQTTGASILDPETTETTPETTTKKKTSSKKRKKNKKKKKPTLEKSGEDQVIHDLIKQPKQPVGAQFYNFLSREIMPTVGLGLVGVLVTAGLAGLLGYNPFYGANIPVRRTYETQHGYYPNGNYYSNNNYRHEYPEADTSKNEEVLFREVLSGMPEDSRYGLPPAADATYPESQLYSSQEQAYQASKNIPPKKEDTYSEPYEPQYDSYTNQEQVGAKYPVYSGDSYYSEPSTEKFKVSAKYSEETFEKQPEALYRVSEEYSEPEPVPSSDSTPDSDQSWHRIGAPMDSTTHLEPGPRRLDLNKMTENLTHKRSRRSPEGLLARLVRRSNEVVKNFEDDKENEVDFEEGAGSSEVKTNTEKPTEMSSVPETTVASNDQPTTSLLNETQASLMESFPTANPQEPPPSLMDVLRRLAQFKLRLGISFLKASTEAFGKYLEGVQQRVEDSMASDTNFPAKRYAWLGRDIDDAEAKIREKRYQRATKHPLDSDNLVMDS